MTKKTNAGLTPTERRATLGLAAIYGTRMLGLFLILPVFALYAEHLPSATPVLTGIAIGIYGLTQAALQIPFGLLSDRIGRKPVIVGGLLLFAAGSVVAAMAEDIWMIILGRALQGAGAIAAAVMALLADLTRESHRTRAMATVGVTIGFAFTLALIAGPLLEGWVGVPGLFWLTAVLALAAIIVLLGVIPTPARHDVHAEAEPVPGLFGRVLRDPQLLRLDLGIFSLHLVLTALFLALPLELVEAGLPSGRHAWLYLPVMVGGMALMVPLVILAEKGGRMKEIFLAAIGLLGLAQLGLYAMQGSLWGLGLALLAFFTAFNLLEATLPSLVSRLAPGHIRGTAMGVYSTAQFSGAFFGGLSGGWVHQHYGTGMVFITGALITLVWLLSAQGLEVPRREPPRRKRNGRFFR